MPSLTTVTLDTRFAFREKKTLHTNSSSSSSSSLLDITPVLQDCLSSHHRPPLMPIHQPNPNANIHSVDDLMRMDRSIEELIVYGHTCNDKTFTVLDLSSFVNLKVFEVDDYCFGNVNEVKLVGLHALEKVLIEKYCFIKSDDRNPNGHFYLKDCEKLKELKMGHYSFFYFTVCEIENVPSLEVIEIGTYDDWSFNFEYASLELKSDGDEMK